MTKPNYGKQAIVRLERILDLLNTAVYMPAPTTPEGKRELDDMFGDIADDLSELSVALLNRGSVVRS